MGLVTLLSLHFVAITYSFRPAAPVRVRSGRVWSAPEVYDLSSAFGVLKVEGLDARSFLHGQCTNDVSSMAPCDVRVASFTNPAGRLIDLATIISCPPSLDSSEMSSSGSRESAGDRLFVLCSASRTSALAARLNKVIFRLDRVTVADASAEMSALVLAGNREEGGDTSAGRVLESALPEMALPILGRAASAPGEFGALVFGGTGLGRPGATLLVPAKHAGMVRWVLSRLPPASTRIPPHPLP